MPEKSSSICHYFVDEPGDGTLFNRQGKILIGTEGCSHFFILGLLNVLNPESLSKDLEELRANLLADPYFKKVPSMQLEDKKTAIAFHAKDDIPEVRREVFALLKKHELEFFAVVRNKHKLLEYVRGHKQSDPFYRLYERGEDRYVEFLWSGFRLVHDLDHTRHANYGVYYTRKNPLT